MLDPVCDKLTTDVLAPNEPVNEPVKEPDNNEGRLDENEPVNGPLPPAANEVEVTLTTDVEIANEAVSQWEAEITEPNNTDAVSAFDAVPSN